MRSYNVLVPLAAFAAQAVASTDTWNFGYGFYLGPPSSATITRASCGYTADSNDEPWVSLWIGISNTESSATYDLYQPLLNWAPDNESQGCDAPDDQWCVATSSYMNGNQVGQAYVTVPKDTQVDFETYVEDDKVYQVVTIDGKVVSKQSDALSEGDVKYMISGDECYTGGGACGTIEAYSYTNITVELSAKDESFGSTFAAYDGITSDGGKTWVASAIKIAGDAFTAEE
ncbi:hypothetical protein BO78DRAFT_424988 [Aspergillus sclerotiicarbonarius CBS 121057]|uniref:Concanavalin A-like lectin/glucanase n=1 Tax=Aspergillus sclerotiicarbonarius (strain CBS 121057 / IBT 28362) TaxID=1448318 RepID=A0A319F870_ASPSB|nr:hypothetical protein BO78DRAFT_424988 [Aspergillus sclerotiicarbonarius CBS 121057]